MRIAVYAAALCCIAVTARSQTPTEAKTTWASGLSIGVPGVVGMYGGAEPMLFTVGGNFTQIGPRAGADIAIFTAPRIMMEGAIPVAFRIGIARGIADPTSRTYLVPAAGLVGVGIATETGGGATGGWYAGMALMSFGESGRGIRMALNLHGQAAPDIWHLEFGLVGR